MLLRIIILKQINIEEKNVYCNEPIKIKIVIFF